MIQKGAFLASGIFFFASFFLKNLLLPDPDFGWHLRTGQIIESSGIPKTDPFSYTMPNYPYIDHAWLTDLIIAKLYPLIGMWGLALISVLITFAAIFLTLSIKKAPSKRVWWLGLTLLTGSFFAFETIRPLIMSWFLFSFLLFIFWEKERLQKWRALVPLAFLAWANLHGGFVIGLLTYGVFLIAELIRKQETIWKDLEIFVVCILITLINPYGFGLWHEVWNTVTSSSLKTGIAEWLPSFFSFEPALIVLVSLGTGIIVRYRSRLSLERVLLFLFFLFLGVSGIRHAPFLALVSAPILFEGLTLLIKDVRKIKFGEARLGTAINFCLILGTFLFLVYGTTFIWKTFLSPQKETFYPEGAVGFLHQNLPSGQIFSIYGWGGYLIWKLPEKKVFVDGRMAIWEENGYSAFRQQQEIVSGKTDYRPVFSQYNIDTVLWPQLGKSSGTFDALQEKIGAFFGTKGNEKGLIERLFQDGWRKIYEDGTAVIYQKK